MTPGRWLTRGASVTSLLFAVVSVAVLSLAQRTWMGGRIPSASVTGSAALAAGDSGVFASPILPSTVRARLPHADAESAAVAIGYWEVPSVQDVSVPYYKERPLERRHFCGRSYYVRPVVAMPDTNVISSNVGNDWGMWAPTWVMPICDDAERVRTTVLLSDVTLGLRVIQGDGPGDAPELVPTPGTFPHIGYWHSRYFPDSERGIGMTPETAIAVAAARLIGTGARVAEVPEAFTIIMPPNEGARSADSRRTFARTAICPRWRLTLDRPVALRGTQSGQVVRTRTLYVARGALGCEGAPVLQIPKPSQPTTVAFSYSIRPVQPRDSVPSSVKHRPPKFPDTQFRWTTLRVSEPIWFEDARVVR